MTRGLFDLDISINESADEDDILNMNINGDTNTEESKKEKSIPIPNDKEIDAKTYNTAMDSLKKTFKESYELVEMLQGMKLTESDEDTIPEEYIENVAFGAIFDYYDNGAFFEAIDNENKKSAKEAIKKIRNKMSGHGIGEKYGLRQYWSIPAKMLLNLALDVPTISGGIITSTTLMKKGTIGVAAGVFGIVGSIIGPISAALTTPLHRWWIKFLRKNRSFTAKWWQMVGGFNVPKGTSDSEIEEILNKMRDDYKDELGDFTFNLIKIGVPTKVLRLLVAGTSKGYILIIDEKEKKTETINLDANESEISELKEVVEKSPSTEKKEKDKK